MKYGIEEIADNGGWEFHCERPVAGLDIGSRASKGVLLTAREVYTALIPTGLFMQETAEKLLAELLISSGMERRDIGFIVGTGYGRISIKFDDIPYEVVTEISCHAMGAHVLHPNTRTIIDIGGQDSKAIRLDTRTGKVADFVMNDKCAAGTGQFLEKAAVLLGLDLNRLGEAALGATDPATISSQCVVFAESEMISLRAKGSRRNDSETVANLAAGVHYSAARRVRNLLGRVGTEPELIFTGGVSNNPGMRRALEELIGIPFTASRFDMIHAGALGAAVYAVMRACPFGRDGRFTAHRETDAGKVADLVKRTRATFTDRGVRRKKVGYFCSYTPLELLSASGVMHARLLKTGSPETVAAGELVTQSVFCDFTKSCIGAFKEGDPFCKSLDRVYGFHTCTPMKHACEVLERYAPVRLFNLPKLRDREVSRSFFRSELIRFREDLAELTGQAIPDSAVSSRIVLYNKVRVLMRRISELRKRAHPPLSGSEFLDLVLGYFTLPPEQLLDIYEPLYQKWSAVPNDGEKKGPRLMIAGSIVGEGDRRLVKMIEDELGLSVVVEDHCTGVKPFCHTIAETGDPILALAEGYLDQSPCARMKPLADSLEFSGRLAREYAVDGVLYVYLKFCACYGVGKKAFVDHFRTLGLPVLEISSDYSGSDRGQLKTRIEAFIELLNAKRS